MTIARVPNPPQDVKQSAFSRIPASYLSHDFTRPVRDASIIFDRRVINQVWGMLLCVKMSKRVTCPFKMNYGQLFEQSILKTTPRALLPLRDGVTQFGSAFARLAADEQTSSSAAQSTFACARHTISRLLSSYSVVRQ